ncbi:hypothetical protein FCM35_KLT06668 [Carex littledalei]|uniref:KIB1-4 beta-propeller domain-containing protein n=1 Tax=Carex littledalei TaxID=544730 RepID=A0A833V7X7_9POAL|nr:hypothetical protein FCM35_KLT06668 [Carex littledalei]
MSQIFCKFNPDGHLLRFMPSQNHIVILNPLTGDELSSPLLPQDCKIYNPFPVLIFPLSSPDSGLLVFTSESKYEGRYDTLHYWQIGSPSWSSHCPRVKPYCGIRMIVATVQGKVYAMDSLHTLFVLDLSPQLHLRPLAVDGLRKRGFSFQHFMVVCDGEFLLLLLVPTNENVMYAQLEETLGNWAIFVGYDSRAQGLAIQNPERWGGRKNCVYFATGNENGDWPWAVVKLGDVINAMDPVSPLF